MKNMVEEIKIGMDYTVAKNLLDIPVVDSCERLEWCNKDFDDKAYGLYPSVQITAREGIITEILITPNLEKYKDLGISIGEKKDTEKVWKECVNYITALYGTPTKDKENKKAWNLENDVKIKVEIEKATKYTINIIIK